MSNESTGTRPAWAYTLSAAVIAFALAAVIGSFDVGMEDSAFVKVVSGLGWIAAAYGAVQFLMSRKG